jgi:hypothetical protein
MHQVSIKFRISRLALCIEVGIHPVALGHVLAQNPRVLSLKSQAVCRVLFNDCVPPGSVRNEDIQNANLN